MHVSYAVCTRSVRIECLSLCSLHFTVVFSRLRDAEGLDETLGQIQGNDQTPRKRLKTLSGEGLAPMSHKCAGAPRLLPPDFTAPRTRLSSATTGTSSSEHRSRRSSEQNRRDFTVLRNRNERTSGASQSYHRT